MRKHNVPKLATDLRSPENKKIKERPRLDHVSISSTYLDFLLSSRREVNNQYIKHVIKAFVFLSDCVSCLQVVFCLLKFCF